MKTKVVCMKPEDTAQDAAMRMREHNIGFLPICDGSGKAIGTVTDRDLTLRLLANGRSAATSLAEVMTKEVVACRSTDDMQRAHDLMGKHQKGRILCTDQDGRPVGVISLTDIVTKGDSASAVHTFRRIAGRVMGVRYANT